MKNTKTLIITGAILIVLVVSGAFIFTNIGLQYKLSPQKMLDEIQTYQDAVRPENVIDIINTADSAIFQFVDLRSPQEFIKGHIPNALNIPSHNLLAGENLEKMQKSTRIFILYHNDHTQACGPWMVLKQLGLKNVKILMGGYSLVNQNIFKTFSPQTANYKDEKPLYNYAKIVSQTSGSTISAPSTQVPTANPVKTGSTPKKKGGGGGC